MAAACPLRDGPAARSCGCRPRRCLSRVLSRCGWPGRCGSAPNHVQTAWPLTALASKGPGGSVCRLDEVQLGRLRAALDLGPAAYGWREDQRWTLARVAALIGRLFGVRYTLRGTSCLLHRIGFTPQVPVHRAAERDEDAIAAWRAKTWAKVRG